MYRVPDRTSRCFLHQHCQLYSQSSLILSLLLSNYLFFNFHFNSYTKQDSRNQQSVNERLLKILNHHLEPQQLVNIINHHQFPPSYIFFKFLFPPTQNRTPVVTENPISSPETATTGVHCLQNQGRLPASPYSPMPGVFVEHYETKKLLSDWFIHFFIYCNFYYNFCIKM